MSFAWPIALALAAAPARAAAPAPAAPAPTDVDRAAAPPANTPFDVQTFLRTGPLAQALAPQPGGLTSDSVAERAVAHAPSVAAKEAQIQAAAAQLDRTIYSYLPQVTAKAGYTRLSKAAINFGGGASVGAVNGPPEGSPFVPVAIGPCAQGSPQNCALDPQGNPLVITPPFKIEIPLNAFSVQAQLAVPLSDYVLSLLPARKGVQVRREAIVLARDAERVKIETDARLAYYNWLRAVAAVVAAEDSLRRVQARQQDVQNLFQAGAATRAEVLRMDAQLAQIQQVINDATALRNTTELMLATMINDPQTEFIIGEDVIELPPEPRDLRDLEELVREGQTNRLEVKSLEKAIGAVDYGVRATRAGYFPRLDGFADVLYANPNQRFFPLRNEWNASWSVGVQLSYTLNSALQAKAQIQEYKANKREMYAQAEALRRGIRLEVASAYISRNKALADIQLSARSLEASAEAYRVASEQFAAGAATTNDIIDAEADQLTAILRIINSRIDLRVANTRLAYATGRVKPNPIKAQTYDPGPPRK